MFSRFETRRIQTPSNLRKSGLLRFAAGLGLCLTMMLESAGAQSPTTTKLGYPSTRRSDVADDYHDTKVDDPYRWLEDDNSDETKAWVTAQNQVTQSLLAAIPQRDKIRARLTELWNFEKFGVPTQRGGRYLFTRNSGLQNQNVLLVTDSLGTPP